MKWKVSVQCAGYSRGWMSAIVEADTAKEAAKMARDADYGPVDIVRDDREVADWDDVEVTAYEPKPTVSDIVSEMRKHAAGCDRETSRGHAVATKLEKYADKLERL